MLVKKRDRYIIEEELGKAEERLQLYEKECAKARLEIKNLKNELLSYATEYKDPTTTTHIINNSSSPHEKVKLFRSLFRGREDVYPKRWESLKKGKSGYQPACANDWLKGLCGKPNIKCANCKNRAFLPLTDEVIWAHLLGQDKPGKQTGGDFSIGVYPIVKDNQCWFVALDFDKKNWLEDAAAFLDTCKLIKIPAYLERSRSGNGGHVWIFFTEKVSATLARKLASYLLTETMVHRPEIGLASYDRIFPSQDSVPQDGLGNLIALPLQKTPRKLGNSVFLDEKFEPYGDQWAFLSSIKRMSLNELETHVEKAVLEGKVTGVRRIYEEADDEPWTIPPSGKQQRAVYDQNSLPNKVAIVLSNQIYIAKEGLPPFLINELVRIAAFQNPEFYKAQAMRLPVFRIPRIIGCAEDFTKHLGIPRGCLDDIIQLFGELDIDSSIEDERNAGTPIRASFTGALSEDQEKALSQMMANDIGVLAAATAFGKTVIAINLIAKRAVNTLVLVHRRQLQTQWLSALTNFLEIEPNHIGTIGSGKYKPSGFIDVAMIQSLNRKGIVDDIVAEYGHVVVDECHHISAKSFENVARQCKAKYITGLSATVIRKDGHHPIIFMQCGPVRYNVAARQHASKSPFVHKVVFRETGFNLPREMLIDNDLSFYQIYDALVADKRRNDLIVKDVKSALDDKRSPIILTERKKHLIYLTEQLSKLTNNVIVLQGGMTAKKKKEALEKIRSLADDEERVIIATGKYLGEGFDDRRLDTLFLTLPISWRGTLAQYAGRLHRHHSSKSEVIIYDYVDSNVPVLAKMKERRLKGYHTIGYKL